MAMSNMVVFDDYVQRTITEVIAQQVDLFNAASNGTITLTTQRNRGDFAHYSQFAEITGLIRRRDVYASGAVNSVALAMLQNASVKVAAGTPPIAFNPSQFTWIQEQPEVAGVVIGEQVAIGQFQDMLNAALKAARAAFVNVGSAAAYNVASQGALTLNGLNRGAQKFGDRAQNIRAWVIHSTPLHDLFDQSLTNTNRLFTFGDVRVIEDGFGRRFIVTDSSSLYGAVTSPDVTDYYTLGLVMPCSRAAPAAPTTAAPAATANAPAAEMFSLTFALPRCVMVEFDLFRPLAEVNLPDLGSWFGFPGVPAIIFPLREMAELKKAPPFRWNCFLFSDYGRRRRQCS